MAIVTAHLEGGTTVEMQARQFSWRGDEPPLVGGTDTGPTPYELLLGGLAACIALTLRLYADHKHISLTGVDVSLEFDRVHADDCLDCDERADGWVEEGERTCRTRAARCSLCSLQGRSESRTSPTSRRSHSRQGS